MYFCKTTLFILSTPKSNKPVSVINMEGLSVDEINESEFGFVVKHRDGVYPEKRFVFESKVLRDEWMCHLQEYKSMSVYDCFTFT